MSIYIYIKNYNAFLDGDSGELSSTAQYSDPSVTIGVGGNNFKFDLEYYVKLRLVADFELSWNVLDLTFDLHMRLQFRGEYELSFRIDIELDGYLRATIAKLLQWSEKLSRVLWVGYVPIMYDPVCQYVHFVFFLLMDVDVRISNSSLW